LSCRRGLRSRGSLYRSILGRSLELVVRRMFRDILGIEMDGLDRVGDDSAGDDSAGDDSAGDIDIPTIMAGIRNQSIFRRTLASISGSISWAYSPTRLIAMSLLVDAEFKADSGSWCGDEVVAFSSAWAAGMLEAMSRFRWHSQEQSVRE
jgi:hypothetical protein